MRDFWTCVALVGSILGCWIWGIPLPVAYLVVGGCCLLGMLADVVCLHIDVGSISTEAEKKFPPREILDEYRYWPKQSADVTHPESKNEPPANGSKA